MAELIRGGIMPVTGTANPALCEECNAALRVDDSWLQEMLRTSASGEPYLLGSYWGNFKPEFPAYHIRYDRLPTLPALSLAAERGCAFCTALRDGLQNKCERSAWWKPHPEPLTLRIRFSWGFYNDLAFLDYLYVDAWHPEKHRLCPGEDGLDFKFFVYSSRDGDPCTDWLKLGKRPCENPWSPNNISLSQAWITECVGGTGPCQDDTVEAREPASNADDDDSEAWRTEEYDSDCEIEASATAPQASTQISWSCEPTKGLFLPARLLDLFPISVRTPGCTSLVESIHLESGIRYAALSYCWGKSKPPILTTRASLESHKESIKFSALPQCLQDAVTVARSLEIRYLWIDALCIVQDDSDDWARESATMWQLFQNAYITIAAATSESFDKGFLYPRRQSEVFEIDFTSALNPQIVGKIAISTTPIPRLWYGPLDYDLRCCKWDTRGWVWQEKSLSKRLLVFGETMIHFKCDHCMRSEDGSNERAHVTVPPGRSHRGTWTRWLAEYTSKLFTFPQDKLPGISGLSKQINQNSIFGGGGPAEYLAGIWYCGERRWPQNNSSWQHQLFWRIEIPRQSFKEMLEQIKCSEPQTYTAPSWSWASRSEGVSWGRHLSERPLDTSGCPSLFEAKIMDHQMNLTGPDPTGRVGPGSYLKLSGLMHQDPLDPSIVEGPRDSSEFYHWYIPKNHITQCLDLSFDWEHSPTTQRNHLYECDIRLFGLWRSRDDSKSSRSTFFHGLLLLRDKVSGLYFRVGIFRIEFMDKSLLSEPFMKRSQWQKAERWHRQSVYII